MKNFAWGAASAAIVLSGWVQTAAAQDRQTTVRIGQIRSISGSISLSVNSQFGVKTAEAFISDRHGVNTILLPMSTDSLQQLRGLIDEAIREISAAASQPTTAETPDPSAAGSSVAGAVCRKGDVVDIECAKVVTRCRAQAKDNQELRECLRVGLRKP